ncbi:MAG: hypothetical protein INH43_08190 [Acidobacteriaceae bacterium]|nr:hypothetical protein [Acidobacteriaceae bacterium]
MKEPFDPPKRAGAVLERLGGRSSSDKADEDDSVRESFAGNRNREDDLMLDVRFKDGTRCALAYGTLMKIFFSPADQLKLAFASGIVVIEGRRLITLYDLLRRHRARYVQEGTLAEEGLKPEDSAHIDHIHFENPEEDEV